MRRSIVQCSRCGFESPEGLHFCGRCGDRLARVCPHCGQEAEPEFKFCGRCGTRLDEGSVGPPGAVRGESPSAEPSRKAGPHPSGRGGDSREAYSAPVLEEIRLPTDDSEIKQATVLYCELLCEAEDSGEAEGSGEAESLHLFLTRFLQVAKEEVARYGGTVNQAFGRGFLALFGAPVAHEDHGLRGILAALGVLRRLAQLVEESSAGSDLQWIARSGLDTGPVVVSSRDGVAAGESIDAARRLAEAAQPGATLLTERLATLVRDHVVLEEQPFDDADSHGGSLPGAWRLARLAAPFAAAPRLRSEALSPFVGRAREMGVLEELVGRAETGEGQVIGITGEPGSGKSRLLHELSRTFRDRPTSYLRAQCRSYTTGIPYAPLIDMIRRTAEITEADDAATVASKVRGSVEAVGLGSDGVLPYLLRLVGVREGSEVLDSLEPQAIKHETFAAMRRMLLAASLRSLVIMEVEDLHWIDATSEEMLDSLIEEMAGSRVLLLLTYRSGYRPRWFHKSYATQITLRHLASDESRIVVRSILGASPEDERVGEIVSMAEGNPFFLEELARSVKSAEGLGTEALIPRTVQGVVMARIDRLPQPHKHLLQVASILGRELSVDLLERLWTRSEGIEGLLADLQRWEFLFKAPSDGPRSYSFKHSLTQEVTYGSLLRSRRRSLHGRVVAALEELFADRLEDAYDRLVFHCPRTGDPVKTVHYLRLFAENAARHFAHAEAAEALRQALTHAERLAEEVRDRAAIEILLELAESLLPLARFAETLDSCRAHQEAVERLADPSLEARFAFWLAHTHTYLGHHEETGREARRAIEAAQRCGDEATEGKAWYVLGRHAFWTGAFATGLEQSLRAVVLLERSGEPWWQGQAYWVAGFHHWARGHFREALAALQRASDIGEALKDHRLDSSWSIGFVHASLGDWEAGLRSCQRGIERSRDPLNRAVAQGFLGHSLLAKGDLDVALQALRDSTECLAQAGMQQLLGWFTVILGETHLAAGRLEEAREVAEEGAQITGEASFPYGTGLALRTLGGIALAAGDLEEARSRLDQAREAFDALEMPFEVARTRMALARLASRRATRDEAGDELRRAFRSFQELDVPIYSERAEALATELGLEACGPVAS